MSGGTPAAAAPIPMILQDRLVDGKKCPHFLLDARSVLAAQHRLPVTHVRLVVADDGLAAPAQGVSAG